MDQERVARAMARIEAAASRIEAAAGRGTSSATSGDPRLQARYDALQREAGEALARIDRLIGTLEA